MTEVTLTGLPTGWCRAVERLVTRRGRLRPVRLFSVAALVEHPALGGVLVDTGYAPRVLAASRRWPYRLYRWATPMTAPPALAAVAQTAYRTERVAAVVLTHLHADHVGGVLDFSGARLLAPRRAWPDRRLRGLAAVRRAVLPDLLPPSLDARVELFDPADGTVGNANSEAPRQDVDSRLRGNDGTGVESEDRPASVGGHAVVITDKRADGIADDRVAGCADGSLAGGPASCGHAVPFAQRGGQASDQRGASQGERASSTLAHGHADGLSARPVDCGALGQGVDLFGDSSMVAVDLPGHARGQIGVIVRDRYRGLALLAADALWDRRALAGGPPSRLTHGIADDAAAQARTVDRVWAWRRATGGAVLPSHDLGAWQAWDAALTAAVR